MVAPSPRTGSPLGTASGTSDATSFAVTLPTHAAGDTLFVFIASDGTGATMSCTGWTQIGAANSTTSKGHLFQRDAVAATSSETNPTFISTAAEQYAAYAYAVPGSALLNIEAASSSGSGAAADAPNLAPSAGTQDYLFIVFYAFDNATIGMSAGPTGYSTPAITGNGVATGATAVTAYKTTTAASSDNPSAATNTSEQWAGFTIAAWETPAAPPPSMGGMGLMMGMIG